jgi:hypothetical protein
MRCCGYLEDAIKIVISRSILIQKGLLLNAEFVEGHLVDLRSDAYFKRGDGEEGMIH